MTHQSYKFLKIRYILDSLTLSNMLVIYTLEVLKWDKNISKKTKRLPVSEHLRATHFGATT